jgi:hypothetical protein
MNAHPRQHLHRMGVEPSPRHHAAPANSVGIVMRRGPKQSVRPRVDWTSYRAERMDTLPNAGSVIRARAVAL